MVERVDGPQGFPAMPPPPPERVEPIGPPPRLVHIAVILLIVNLALSVLVTVLSFVFKDDIIRLTLERSHNQVASDAARQAVVTGLWVRAGTNVLVGVLYLFFISRLYRGKRWAWRRLV